MTTISVAMKQLSEDIANLANFLGDDNVAINDTMFEVGRVVRDICTSQLNSVVYNTPESPNYQRTGYLRASIYVSTKYRNDYTERRMLAAALPSAIYPNRSSNLVKYRMEPYKSAGRRSVRITAGAIYAGYVEYGTDKMSPRPFMRPGAELSRYPAMLTMREGIIEQIRQRRVRRLTATMIVAR